MNYSENTLAEVTKAFIHELGELAKHASRGIAKGEAIKRSLKKMDEKIAAAKKLGITKAEPLGTRGNAFRDSDVDALFNRIEPLTEFSLNNNEIRNVICDEIKNFFKIKTNIEEEFLTEINFPQRRVNQK